MSSARWKAIVKEKNSLLCCKSLAHWLKGLDSEITAKVELTRRVSLTHAISRGGKGRGGGRGGWEEGIKEHNKLSIGRQANTTCLWAFPFFLVAHALPIE